MVSIPDWSKLSRLHETAKPKTESSRERYRRQREEETIKQAEDRGYFLVPSESFIIERCATSRRTAPTRRSHFFNEAQTPPDKKIASMKFVKLPNLHIRRIGDISFCTNLRICILSNNFLDKFDALAACRHLVKLDLHSNQITTVPGIAFWSSMNKLKFLHLHDNPLGKFQILNSLAACSRLMVLTMYDTPVSLKKNYRHHVVNSIWSLQALDRHVISDEEIIEDAQFTDRFTTLHPALRIHLCPATPSHSTFKEERRSMLGVLSRISRILAHNSPVIVIQRHIRGFLARRKIARTRPGYSPYFRPIPMGCVGCYEMPHTTSPTAGIAIPTDRTSEAMGMDYDGYLRGRGGGASTITSLDTPLSSSRLVQDLSLTKDDPKSRLLIDLSKLENETLRSLDKVPPGTPASLLPYDTLEETTPPKSQKKAPKPPKEKAKRSQDVKQFFGPVVQDSASDDLTPSTANMYEEELPLIQFRLQGFCPRHRKIDPTTDMILSRRDAARDIRLAEVEHHQQQLLIPRPQIPPQKRINNEQRLFARVHGTMSTTCLFAVQQAYKDRDKSEKMTAKMENIMDQKRERDLAKHRIKMYHEEKRANAIKEREKDKTQILESMERHAMQRMNYLEKRNGQRVVSGDASKSVRADLRFISEFTNQHTSVSKALMRHDRHTRVEDNMHSKNDFVQGQKHTEKAQHETVRKYMEHRQLMRQTESAMMRAALDTRMLQDANERILQAKSRVAQLKARQATVQAFYPLPHVNSSQVTSAPSPSKHNLERWNTNLTTDGRLEGAVH